MNVKRQNLVKDFSELPEDWAEYAMTQAEEGASKAEIIAYLKVPYTRHAIFMADYPEYKEVFEYCAIKYEAWWVSQGRINLKTKEFNHVLWYMNMKNRFKWRDTPLEPKEGGKPKSGILESAELREKYRSKKNEDNTSVIN